MVEGAPDDESGPAGTDEREPSMGLGLALVPYAALTVVALVSIAIGPLRDALESVEVAPSFPATTTAEGVTQDATDAYAPVAPLTHPGLYLLIGAVVAALAFRRADAFAERGSATEADRPSLGAEVVSDAVPASVAVVLFLVLSAVFEHAGQVTTLAAGIERVAPGSVYVVLASSVGALGSFMTSSNTSSNVLFAPLQQAVATAQELSEPVVIGAQHAGGAIGNSIAPANVALGTGTAGISGREGEVLRRTAPFAAVTALAVGLVALAIELGS